MIRFITPEIISLAYLMEVLSSLDRKLTIQKTSDSQMAKHCLTLKEKCIDIITKLVAKMKMDNTAQLDKSRLILISFVNEIQEFDFIVFFLPSWLRNS